MMFHQIVGVIEIDSIFEAIFFYFCPVFLIIGIIELSAAFHAGAADIAVGVE